MEFKDTIKLISACEELAPFAHDLCAKTNIENKNLATIAILLGYKKHLKVGGKRTTTFQMRGSYFNSQEVATLYSVLLLDDNVNGDVSALSDPERAGEYTTILEEYLNGGLQYLTQCFEDNIIEGVLDDSYTNYAFDLLNIVNNELEATPF